MKATQTLLLTIVLCLLQVFIFSRIQLFGFATPMLQVYLVLLFNRQFPRYASLLWSFFCGLAIDSFSNTPGIGTASMTLIAMMQPSVLSMFVSNEEEEDFAPSVVSMGGTKYFVYASMLTFVFCLAFFTLETFSFFNWQRWLLSVVGSFVMTMIMVIVIENVRKNFR